jgi:uncharacterized protein YndB with AHSA1/START domain
MTDPRETWALDREIVLVRVLNAPRELVFKAWTDPEHAPKWFCPEGFTNETLEVDIRVGGLWRFVFVGPNGRRYENRIAFRKIEAPRLIEFDHGSDKDDDPNRFRVTVTFDEQSDGKTVVTLRQLHPTVAQRLATIGFGAVEIGQGTLNNLERYLRSIQA